MNLQTLKNQKGFTIVELLIVIVVIGILAAITIVAFNGIQNRGKTSAAQSAAGNADKKSEAYNAEVGYYPTTLGALTGASSDKTYQLTGITAATSLTNTSANNSIIFSVCGSGSPAGLANITATNVTGSSIQYRDYGASTNITVTAGVTTGTGIACHASTS